ncbi:MAG: LPS assembly lipoprotein LptE [Planctomycetota bacterium]
MNVPQVCFLILFTLSIPGCAGYQWGNRTLFRNDIRTVHVPVIESESYRRFLGQQLTEAVVKQIELDTPYQIADAALADSFLQCRIVRDLKRFRTLDRFGEPRVLQTNWLVEMKWMDRSGAELSPMQKIQINGSEEFIPEGGQSLTSAQKELIRSLAIQIVGQMESGW